jgi:hypothetical protein
MRTGMIFAALAAAAVAGGADLYVGPAVGVAATGGLAREDYGDGAHEADGVWLPIFGGVRGDVRFAAYDVKAEAVVLSPFKGGYYPPDAGFDERAAEFGVVASGGRRFGAGPLFFRLGFNGRWVNGDVDYANYPNGSYTVNDVLAAPVGGVVYDADLLRFNFNTGVGFGGVYMAGHSPEADRYLTVIWEAEAAFKLRPSLHLNVGVVFLDDVYGFDRGWAERRKILISGGPTFAVGG